MFDFNEMSIDRENIDNIINNFKTNEEVLELIQNFKSIPISENNLRLYFYKKILDNIADNMDLDLFLSVSNQIISALIETDIDYNKYLIFMDVYILVAIRLHCDNKIEASKIYFKKAIDIGEKNIDYSKKNFYDALNCAYSWLGVIYYNENKIYNSYELFNKALEHYDEVKNDPNYWVKEEKTIKICKEYVSEINSKNSLSDYGIQNND